MNAYIVGGTPRDFQVIFRPHLESCGFEILGHHPVANKGTHRVTTPAATTHLVVIAPNVTHTMEREARNSMPDGAEIVRVGRKRTQFCLDLANYGYRPQEPQVVQKPKPSKREFGWPAEWLWVDGDVVHVSGFRSGPFDREHQGYKWVQRYGEQALQHHIAKLTKKPQKEEKGDLMSTLSPAQRAVRKFIQHPWLSAKHVTSALTFKDRRAAEAVIRTAPRVPVGTLTYINKAAFLAWARDDAQKVYGAMPDWNAAPEGVLIETTVSELERFREAKREGQRKSTESKMAAKRGEKKAEAVEKEVPAPSHPAAASAPTRQRTLAEQVDALFFRTAQEPWLCLPKGTPRKVRDELRARLESREAPRLHRGTRVDVDKDAWDAWAAQFGAKVDWSKAHKNVHFVSSEELARLQAKPCGVKAVKATKEAEKETRTSAESVAESVEAPSLQALKEGPLLDNLRAATAAPARIQPENFALCDLTALLETLRSRLDTPEVRLFRGGPVTTEQVTNLALRIGLEELEKRLG